jgi:hypothetical protein
MRHFLEPRYAGDADARRMARSPDVCAGTRVSSRLRPSAGDRHAWSAPDGSLVDLPVIVPLVRNDPETGAETWRIEATVDNHDDEPVLTTVLLHATGGLDVARLQRDFRWNTPLEVVTRLVPRLIANGLDPYSVEFPQTGYPEASHPPGRPRNILSTEFLEDLAHEYLTQGRGYSSRLAAAHSVSPRTIVSWIEKARRAGILTPVRPGQYGGAHVPRSKRTGTGRSRPGPADED